MHIAHEDRKGGKHLHQYCKGQHDHHQQKQKVTVAQDRGIALCPGFLFTLFVGSRLRLCFRQIFKQEDEGDGAGEGIADEQPVEGIIRSQPADQRTNRHG